MSTITEVTPSPISVGSTLVRTPRRTAEQIETLLADYDASGLSQRAFATESGVKLPTFVRWLSLRRNRASSASSESGGGFAVVKIGGARQSGGAGGPAIIRLPGGIEAEFHCTASELTGVLRALALSCSQ